MYRLFKKLAAEHQLDENEFDLRIQTLAKQEVGFNLLVSSEQVFNAFARLMLEVASNLRIESKLKLYQTHQDKQK